MKHISVPDGVGRLAAAVLLVAAAEAGAARLEDRFLYFGADYTTAEGQTYCEDVIGRAAKAGFNGVVFQGGGIEYAFHEGDHNRNGLKKLKAICDRHGIELIPAVWSCGYGTMQPVDPNLAEGLPVFDVPYTVSADGTRAVFDRPEPLDFPNGGFEDVKYAADGRRFTVAGWGVDEPGTIAFVDREVKHSGSQSLRFDLDEAGKRSDPQSRAWRTLKLRPNRRYFITAWLKTEGLDTAQLFNHGFQMVVYTKARPGEKDGCTVQLTSNAPRFKTADNDWLKMTCEISSLEYEEVVLWVGSWKARKGRFWLDDLQAEEQAFPDMLRRDGCPLTVRDAADGTVYEPGRDYVDIPPLKKGQEQLPRENNSLVLAIPPGSRIGAGAKLRLDGYRRHVMKSSSQTCTCMCERSLYRLFAKSATTIEEILHPKKWFLPQDEVRMGGTCKACRDRGTDMAHIFGDCVKLQHDIIKRVSPDAKIYMWSDQIDPNMNARKVVQMCRGSYVDAHKCIPKDITAVHWGGRPADSLKFFRDNGFSTIRSREVDAGDWSKGVAPQGVRDDFWTCLTDPVCSGYMYTTWCRNYQQVRFDAFTKLFREGDDFLRANSGAKQGGENRWVRWGRACYSEKELAEGKTMIDKAAKAGFNGMTLCGLDWLYVAKEKERGYVRELKKYADRKGVRLVPHGWSIGYGTMAGGKSPLTETIGMKDFPFVARGDDIVSVKDGASVVNGMLEKYDLGSNSFAGWWSDRAGRQSFVDLEVRHDGHPSIRFHPEEADQHHHSRFSQKVDLLPHRRYRFSTWVRGERLWPEYGPVSVQVYPKGGANVSKLVHFWDGKDDWKKVSVVFSTGDEGEVRLYVGSWCATEGRFWISDLSLEEVGLTELSCRKSAPRTLRSAESGRVYAEGKDWKLADFKPDEEVHMIRTPGSAIRDGEKLFFDCYIIARCGPKSQLSTCPSDPELYKVFEKSMKAVEEELHPGAWFLSLDEILNGGTCELCEARQTDMAHIIGECVTKMCDIIHRLDPKAEIYAWSDMLDPNHNAKPKFGGCKGSFTGVWNLIPKDLNLMLWYGKMVPKSVPVFVQNGNHVMGSICIDGKGTGMIESWKNDLWSLPGVKGFMYTTWVNKYDEKLDDFIRILSGK